MNKRLYVGNLPYETTERELAAHFEQMGPVVDTRIPYDAYAGRSKGFGFVEMADEHSAQAAIARFDGTQVGGRTIKVAEARPRQSRPSSNSYTYAYRSYLR